MKNPDFYLASSENYDLLEPRKCFRIRRIKGNFRDDYLLIKIEPSYIYNNIELDEIIIAPRWEGYSLFPLNEWGQPVYVLYPKKGEPKNLDFIDENSVSNLAWAEIYENEKLAKTLGRDSKIIKRGLIIKPF